MLQPELWFLIIFTHFSMKLKVVQFIESVNR